MREGGEGRARALSPDHVLDEPTDLQLLADTNRVCSTSFRLMACGGPASQHPGGLVPKLGVFIWLRLGDWPTRHEAHFLRQRAG